MELIDVFFEVTLPQNTPMICNPPLARASLTVGRDKQQIEIRARNWVKWFRLANWGGIIKCVRDEKTIGVQRTSGGRKGMSGAGSHILPRPKKNNRMVSSF